LRGLAVSLMWKSENKMRKAKENNRILGKINAFQYFYSERHSSLCFMLYALCFMLYALCGTLVNLGICATAA